MTVHSAWYTLPVSTGFDGQHVFLQRDLPPAFLAVIDLPQRRLESIE